MRLLDLFCGAGGAAMGYHNAGFQILGVDIQPQPNYPFDFIQADAMKFPLRSFDIIHASPPCQAYSRASYDHMVHPELIELLRVRFQNSNKPYIIENVPQAPLSHKAITLCGTQFNLPILRHRKFECSFPIVEPPYCGYIPTSHNLHRGFKTYPYARGKWKPSWKSVVLPTVWPWMKTLKEAGQAIPPAYTEWIGKQIFSD